MIEKDLINVGLDNLHIAAEDHIDLVAVFALSCDYMSSIFIGFIFVKLDEPCELLLFPFAEIWDLAHESTHLLHLGKLVFLKEPFIGI